MSNLLKSKFLLGAMVATVMFVGVFALVGVKSASADCSITRTLRVGSKGEDVMCLQTALGGLTADGNFGAKTKAAVMKFQSNEGLTADGVFGPKSNAAWVANQFTGNFPAGCNSASGFSNTTGQSCATPQGSVFPAGCSSNSGFSNVTGLSCAGTGVVSGLPVGCTSTSGFSPVSGLMCNTLGSFPAGCTSSSGFSPTTGGSCAGNVALPAGCSTSNGFSPTTGVSCSTGSTTTTNSGEGELTSISKLGSFNNVKVAEGQVDVAVLGVQATAKDAVQNVDTFRVAFKNINPGSGLTASSVKLAKYVQDISIWLDGKEIGRKSVSAFSDDAGDTYTYRFTGMTGVIPANHQSQILVAVSGVTSMDTVDANNANWQIGAGTISTGDSDFITSSSSNGRFNDAGPSGINSNIDFQKAGGTSSDQRYRVSVASTNPLARTVQVSRTSDTTGALLLAFDVKAENGAMRLQRLPVDLTVLPAGGSVVAPDTVAPNVEAIVKSAQLFANGVKIADESVPIISDATCTGVGTPAGCVGAGTRANTHVVITFGNTSKLQYLIAQDATVHFEVRVDMNDTEDTNIAPSVVNGATDFDEGDQIRADYTTADVNASTIELDNVNQDSVNNRSGSASGELQTARSTGGLVTMGTPSIVFTPGTFASATNNKAVFNIPVTVKAFDDTLFISQNLVAAVAADAAFAAATGPTSNAFSFTLNNATASTVQLLTPPTGGVTQTISSSATTSGAAWRIDSGATQTFNIQVIVTGATAAANLRVQLNDFKFFTAPDLVTGGVVQNLTPQSAFQTSFSSVF